LRELAHDQRLDVRPPGLLVAGVRPDVADVGIGQADNLTGVTGVGEDFLVAGEAGIENDFAAAAGAGARRAAAKDASVLEREGRAG
jgi:hypothetical protein